MPVVAWEFYSGIGGLHLALLRSKIDGQVTQAFDWDQTASRVYATNFGADFVKKVDISSLTASALMGSASPMADLWLMSPACQPYTVLNPKAQGAADPRAKSFLHLIQNVLPDLVNLSQNVHPMRLLVENVAGFETSSTRQILVSTLQSLGYATMEFLLNPLQFGIPNSRLRYYLLAKKAPLSFPCLKTLSKKSNGPWRHIPGYSSCDWVDTRAQAEGEDADNCLVRPVSEYLEDDLASGSHPRRIPDHVLQKWGRLFDIVTPSSRRTCCFTRGYTRLVERSGSILQLNEDLDTTNVFDHFLKAQAAGNPNAVDILRPLELRYFSPTELLQLFSFIDVPQHNQTSSVHEKGRFNWPDGVSDKAKYRLIGNSINVVVVTNLINFLFED